MNELKKYVKTDTGEYTDIMLTQSQSPIKTYEIIARRSRSKILMYRGKDRAEADRMFDQLAQKYVLQLSSC